METSSLSSEILLQTLEQFSRQAAWAIVMYNASGQETQEKQCFVQVFTFFILCRSRKDVGTASFPLEILLHALKSERFRTIE